MKTYLNFYRLITKKEPLGILIVAESVKEALYIFQSSYSKTRNYTIKKLNLQHAIYNT